MEHWKQFSLYPLGCRNRFQPQQVFYTFLPRFIACNSSITIWHVLFEPSALIRFCAPNMDVVLRSARDIATECGLECELGDCSFDLNPKLQWPGEDYYGEAKFYGEELWEASKRVMHANSLLALALAKEPVERQVFMYRKFEHLLHNAMGMNFLEEAALAQAWGDRSMELYRQFGRL
jgi:hypothetical protein